MSKTNFTKSYFINYFTNKYKIDLNLISDKNLVIPEYKIELLNKNKKIINKLENIEQITSNESIDYDAKKDHIRKSFLNKKFNKYRKKNRFKDRFNYRSKNKKHNFEQKKSVNY